jgi:uncharacterized protein
VKLYLDSSAIVKLVTKEAESERLRGFLASNQGDSRVTSTLARVEVVRAVAGGGPAAISHARRQLNRLDQIGMDDDLLNDAATLQAGEPLRSLDAIHLATARLLGADLRAVLTYDQRMAEAAAELGMVVEAPA